MDDGVCHLASIVGTHLREWEPTRPFVELAIFGSDDPLIIARAIEAFCLDQLGARVARGLFYQSSIGSVAGVALADGRRVVIKTHQPERPVAFLAEIVRVQRHLADSGVFAADVIAGPSPLGHGHAVVESFIDIGVTEDAHRPEIRAALAAGLRTIITTCAPLVGSSTLERGLLARPDAPLWPTPHSKLFDFEATASGAEWIDEVASLARQRMAPAGVRVIGHGDWRAEHVRFLGDKPVAAFDWDSLCCQLEPELLGTVAHGFCADWSRSDRRQAPTMQEARAFSGDYEKARGSAFSASERRLLGASFAYACAYTARCGHSLGGEARDEAGTFQHLVWTEGANLLEL